MLLYPMINFNLMKNIIFLFYEHKNTELNHFSYISKEANFRVLQFYPLRWISSSRFTETDEKDKDALREAKVTAALETKTLI